ADFLVAADQEGGGVLRLLDVPYPPGAMALGAAADPDLTRRVATATGRGLAALGVNVDFAPVADVNSNPANPVIADRAFGSAPAEVADHVVAFIQGLQQAGVAATVKHFPGHGDTDTDSHLALPRLDAGREQLEAAEFVPFRAAVAAGAAAVMSAHILLPQLDPTVPATLSRPLMTGLLRDSLGFDGTVFTDALNMRAIADTYGPAEAAVRALAAGCDMPVHVGPLAEHAAVLAAYRQAVDGGRLDPAELVRSEARVRRLARRYPGSSRPEAAWQDGDAALLAEAARRGLVSLGGFRPLPPGARLVLVAARSVAASAASQTTIAPAQDLARALEAQGFAVTEALYDRQAPEQDRAAALALARDADAALFVSAGRTRMHEAETDLARAVAATTAHFVHVALWNPYQVLDVPGPALVSFGFRPASLRAVAAALAGEAVTGVAPVPLEPLTPSSAD
ncbi:MAG TPA: glycoside hydrolase family 3 N-terminal domain-containing protein, partial [Trueperaceae bacterium]